MPTAGEQIGKTIVKLTQENADWSREVERMTRATQLASELIEDLRCYVADWNWKYGETWDAMENAIAEKARDA